MTSRNPTQLSQFLRLLRPIPHVLPKSAPISHQALRHPSRQLSSPSRPLSGTRPFHSTSITSEGKRYKDKPKIISTEADPSIPVPTSEPEFPKTAKNPIPEYLIVFTCRPCGHRSSHRITKQGYHHGTVLIQCPECKNRHVVSDHFKIFSDLDITIEDILKERGEEVVRGSLNDEGGSVEWFQGNGIRVARKPPFVPKTTRLRGVTKSSVDDPETSA